jgi:hypothetical protein
VGGVKRLLALAELGLIDEYEFVVQPRLVGHRPTLCAGLSKRVGWSSARGRWRCGMSLEGTRYAKHYVLPRTLSGLRLDPNKSARIVESSSCLGRLELVS